MGGGRNLLLMLGVMALFSWQVYVSDASLLDEVIDKIVPEEKKNTTESVQRDENDPPKAADVDDGGDAGGDPGGEDGDDDDDDDDDEKRKAALIEKAKQNIDSLEKLEDLTEDTEQKIENMLLVMQKTLEQQKEILEDEDDPGN